MSCEQMTVSVVFQTPGSCLFFAMSWPIIIEAAASWQARNVWLWAPQMVYNNAQ